MPTPVPSLLPLAQGSNLAQYAVGVKSFVLASQVVAGRPSNPGEDYNYKSSAHVSGCNLHHGWLFTPPPFIILASPNGCELSGPANQLGIL